MGSFKNSMSSARILVIGLVVVLVVLGLAMVVFLLGRTGTGSTS